MEKNEFSLYTTVVSCYKKVYVKITHRRTKPYIIYIYIIYIHMYNKLYISFCRCSLQTISITIQQNFSLSITTLINKVSKFI
jgi:hypothetical protein